MRCLPSLTLFALLVTAPALAVEDCTAGLAVITPDGGNATVTGGKGAQCDVTLSSGKTARFAAEALMPDFGGAEDATPEGAGGTVGDGPGGLVTGYYLCGDPAEPLEIEIVDDGRYADGDGHEGHVSADADGRLTLTDGPLKGREGKVEAGLLALALRPGGSPVGCELLEE